MTEKEFWEMSLAELERYFKSKKRVMEAQERKQASFDYLLADLIGRSVARIYNSSNKLPPIYEAYPTLFDGEEIQKQREEQEIQKFVVGLKQFALSHNQKIGREAK